MKLTAVLLLFALSPIKGQEIANSLLNKNAFNLLTPSANIYESEPNDTFSLADASGIVINSATNIAGSITPVGDLDTFKVVLSSNSIIRFEIYSSGYVDCDSSANSVLRLFDSGGTQIYSDDVSGIRNCSSLAVPLNAGTYYVRVEENGNDDAIASYLLRITFPVDAGTEVESNNTIAFANFINGSSPFYVSGFHQLNGDADYFRINVPQGESLRAEIIEGDGTETCESNGIDSRLTLYNSSIVQIADDDDDGRGLCSQIDGRGETPLDSGAKNLPAGNYYIQVRASANAQTGAAGQFNYRLVLEFSPVIPTAARVTIAGRVLTREGKGLMNENVSLTDFQGNYRMTRTSSFGYYRFQDVQAGQTYKITVVSKRFQFTPQVLNLNQEETELNFVADN